MTPYPGMDMSSLQQLIQQFSPKVDPAQERSRTLLTLGLGLLGARKGQELDRLGQAGLLAMQQRTRDEERQRAQQLQNMQAAGLALGLQDKLRQTQANDIYANALGGAANATPSPTAGMTSLAPTNANAADLAQRQTAVPSQYDRQMAQADYLEAQARLPQNKAGAMLLMQQAQKIRDDALKFRNEYGQPVAVSKDGSTHMVRFGKYGGEQDTGYNPKPDMHAVPLGGTTTIQDFNAIKPGTSFDMTPTPDALMTDARGQQANKIAAGRLGVAQEELGLRRQEAEGTISGMSQDAITNAAARYNIDGTLPPMGMSRAAAAIRSQILNTAAQQAAEQGLTPDAQRGLQIANKGNTQAYGQVAKQEAMVGAFEKNFTKNADLALQQSAKVDRTGMPIVNKWVNAGKRAVTGDPDLSAFDAVLKATVNEYSKIMSGSMGNQQLAEGEIKKVEALLGAAQTPQQVMAVINMMKQETANRMSAFAEQKQEIMHSINRGGIQNSGKTIDFKDMK